MRQISKEVVVISENGLRIVYPSVWETNDVSILNFIPSNRPVIPSHIRGMFDSVVNMGVLRDLVVVRCNFKLYVGDGQHLKECLKMLGGVPFRFKLIDVENELDVFQLVTKMNTTQKRFTFRNFILGWSIFKPEYKILLEYSEKYKIVDTVLCSILTGQPISTAKNSIKNGTFEIKDLTYVTKMLDTIYKYSSLTGFKLERYGSEGLYEFISGITMETYLNHEQNFINESKKFVNERGISHTTFGDTKTYIQFFSKIWELVK